jgi:hypothetical protein
MVGKPKGEDDKRPAESKESIVEGALWEADEKAHFRSQVASATLVLDYATGSGFTTASNRKVSDQIIAAIEKAQDLASREVTPSAEDRTAFEKAYRDLSLLVTPVTAETLRATSERFPVSPGLFMLGRPRPISILWSHKLSTWAILFIIIAVTGTLVDVLSGPLPEASDRPKGFPSAMQFVQVVFQTLVPFTYGAIGACVSLLKTCQVHIHQRQFDPRRIPEYSTRAILGAISGGIIVILIDQIAGGGDETSVRISAAALGFIAGYNNELLFGAVERISAAILPRVGLDSVQQQPKPAPVVDEAVKDLAAQLATAKTREEKKALSAILEKVAGRM